METFILAAIVILLSVGGLAVGVTLGRPPIRGSCGGLACDGACEACRGDGKGAAP